MNETAIRSALHRQAGELIDFSREVVHIGSTQGCLMNKEALGEVIRKLDNIAAHAFLLKCDVEQAIAGLGEEEQP